MKNLFTLILLVVSGSLAAQTDTLQWTFSATKDTLDPLVYSINCKATIREGFKISPLKPGGTSVTINDEPYIAWIERTSLSHGYGVGYFLWMSGKDTVAIPSRLANYFKGNTYILVITKRVRVTSPKKLPISGKISYWLSNIITGDVNPPTEKSFQVEVNQ